MNANDEAAARAELVRQLDRIKPWLARTDAQAGHPTTPAESPMGEDDKHLHPYHISHAAWSSLSHASDHLQALRLLLATGQIPMFAPYTLIRAGLENASMAVWLLDPASRVERTTRRLRVAADDIRHGEDARAITGKPGPKTKEQRLAEVQRIAARCGVNQQQAIKGASYSWIIKAVSRPDRLELLAWNVCSGMAHGDLWTTLSAAELTSLPGGTPDVGAFAVTAKTSLLANFTSLAADMTERGWALYDQRTRTS